MTAVTVHVAAPPAGLYQRCILCGRLLADATGWTEQQRYTTSSIGALDTPPAWYPPGVRIGIESQDNGDTATFVLTAHERLTVDEQLCAPGRVIRTAGRTSETDPLRPAKWSRSTR